MRSILSVIVLFAALVALARPDDSSPSTHHIADRDAKPYQDLWRRRGGGGSGGRGVSSSGRGGSSRSGTGTGTGGRGSPGSVQGGRTTTGSGPPPRYGGGTYGGGAAVPYRSGNSVGSITPFLIGAGVGLAFWPGIWAHSAYIYPYARPYGFYNQTSNRNQSMPVLCGCEDTKECSCEENANTTAHINELVGNGSYAALDKQVVNVANVNGTDSLLINGTLPAGTTAAGGTESPNAGAILYNTGWWPVVAIVVSMVFVV